MVEGGGGSWGAVRDANKKVSVKPQLPKTEYLIPSQQSELTKW